MARPCSAASPPSGSACFPSFLSDTAVVDDVAVVVEGVVGENENEKAAVRDEGDWHGDSA